MLGYQRWLWVGCLGRDPTSAVEGALTGQEATVGKGAVTGYQSASEDRVGAVGKLWLTRLKEGIVVSVGTRQRGRPRKVLGMCNCSSDDQRLTKGALLQIPRGTEA